MHVRAYDLVLLLLALPCISAARVRGRGHVVGDKGCDEEFFVPALQPVDRFAVHARPTVHATEPVREGPGPPVPRPSAAGPRSSTLVATAAAAPGAPALPPKKSFKRLSIASVVGAAVAAGAELFEDVSSVGHAHGIVILAFSRLAKDIKEVSESIGEAVEETSIRVTKVLKSVIKVLTTRMFLRVLASAALVAAGKEVFEDLEPGGHHGAMLLALSELFENLEASGTRLFGLVPLFLENPKLQLAVPLSAMALAGRELAKDFAAGGFKLAGHHGVALLATAKLLKYLGPLVEKLFGEAKEE